jgi:hypothetical protein
MLFNQTYDKNNNLKMKKKLLLSCFGVDRVLVSFMALFVFSFTFYDCLFGLFVYSEVAQLSEKCILLLI